MYQAIYHPLLLAVTVLACCLAEHGVSAEQNPAAGVNELMRTVSTALAAETNTTSVVDFRVLKSLLPESLPAMTRTNCYGEKYGPMGMTISFAAAQFEGTNRAVIGIKISDQGHRVGGLLLIAQAPWSESEIDRETDAGYEKTSLFAGCKAYEQYTFADQSGDIQILVAGRFLVEINGDNVAMDQMKLAAGALDLQKLAALSPAGAVPPAAPAPASPRTATNVNPRPATNNKVRSLPK